MPSQSKEHTSARQVVAALYFYVCLMSSVLALSWIDYHFQHTPDRRPLFTKSDQFRDLLNYMGRTAHLWRSSAALGSGYPIFAYMPPSAFLWHALFMFHGHPLRPYMLLVGLAILALTAAGVSMCRGYGRPGAAGVFAIGMTALLGFPLWFAVDRANLEGVTWALSGAAFCFFLGRKYRASAVFLGLAASIKPFPLALVILFILRRKFKEAALAAAMMAGISLFAYIGIGPNPWKAFQDLQPGFDLYNNGYVRTIRPVEEVRFSHSILDGAKLTAVAVRAHSLQISSLNISIQQLSDMEPGWRALQVLAAIYPLVLLTIFAAIVLCARRMPALNQVTIFALAATLLPPNSGEYTLLNLYVPFGAMVVLLVRELPSGGVAIRRETLISICCIYALLFAPLTFLRVYSGATKLLLLLVLLMLFIRTPMPSAYFGDEIESAVGGREYPTGVAVTR